MSTAVIFDFDGVIINSQLMHYQACCEALKSFDIRINYEDYVKQYCGLSDIEAFQKILRMHCHIFSYEDISNMVECKKKSYIKQIDSHGELPFIPNVELYISQLIENQKKLAICSGSSRKEVLSVLARLEQGNLKQYFETIITIDDVNKGKPDPEGYLLALSHLNIQANNCLVIEDSPRGVAAAKQAGIKVTALLTTHKKQDLYEADEIVNGFKDLLINK